MGPAKWQLPREKKITVLIQKVNLSQVQINNSVQVQCKTFTSFSSLNWTKQFNKHLVEIKLGASLQKHNATQTKFSKVPLTVPVMTSGRARN